jgi:hypothetical protein
MRRRRRALTHETHHLVADFQLVQLACKENVARLAPRPGNEIFLIFQVVGLEAANATVDRPEDDRAAHRFDRIDERLGLAVFAFAVENEIEADGLRRGAVERLEQFRLQAAIKGRDVVIIAHAVFVDEDDRDVVARPFRALREEERAPVIGPFVWAFRRDPGQ